MGEDIWTVGRILEWIQGYLDQHGDENPRVSAQWLVSEALGVTRMQLFLDSQRPLSAEERAVLRDWTRRRAAGEPLQYITGEVSFRHITVKVQPGVLIPRPETEVLVSEALALLPAAPKPQDEFDRAILQRFAQLTAEDGEAGERAGVSDSNSAESPLLSGGVAATGEDLGLEPVSLNALQEETLLVADICTGSGCIACSIASEHPLTRVVATDVSPHAVSLATRNVELLGLQERVRIVECDLASGIDPDLLGHFDLVVSNPPYIPTAVLSELSREVSDYEPALALDGGGDGLAVFRRLLAWCSQALATGGALAFELHETCLEQAAEEASDAGFHQVRIIDDLAGRPRVLTARKA